MNKDFFLDSNKVKEVRFTKDLDRRFTFVNNYFIDIVKFYSGIDIKKENVIGYTGESFLPQKSIAFFNSLEDLVCQEKCLISRFTTFKFNLHTVSAIASVMPFYDLHVLKGLMGTVRYLNLFHLDGHHVMLSHRELQILVHMAFGFKLKIIASNLGISLGTTASYIAKVKQKLCIQNQKQLLLILKKHALAEHLLDFYFRMTLQE